MTRGFGSLAPAVGRAMRPTTLQRFAWQAPVLWPESFRGGCSFGAHLNEGWISPDACAGSDTADVTAIPGFVA